MADCPCETCTKVNHPEQCTSKTCPDWKAWWLERWEAIHDFGRRYVKKKRRTEDGN